MPRRHLVPEVLRRGLFTHADASSAGVTADQLRGSGYRRVGSGFYRWVELQEGPQVLLSAIARRLPAGAAFSGWTAAWLHGLDVAPCDPIEVTIPAPFASRRRNGAYVRRAALGVSEIVKRRGLPTTSALRMVFDLAARNPLTEAVVAADLALRAQLVSISQLRAFVAGHPKARGIARLRRVVDLAEPLTESPMETRLRMILVNAGLPRPEAQVRLSDEEGRFVGRPDLLYPGERLVIEFDGGNHRDRLVDDNHRQNCLVAAGFRLLRFTATDVYRTPDAVVASVRRELSR